MSLDGWVVKRQRTDGSSPPAAAGTASSPTLGDAEKSPAAFQTTPTTEGSVSASPRAADDEDTEPDSEEPDGDDIYLYVP